MNKSRMTAKIGNNLILRKKSIYKHQELTSFADIKKTELRALMAFDTVAYGNDGVEVVIICGLAANQVLFYAELLAVYDKKRKRRFAVPWR